jgi:hypothetical protein
MKATIKSECVIRGERFAKGEVIEVSEQTFEKLEKAGCADRSTVAEKVVSGVKNIGKGGKGKGGKVVNREINTGKGGRKIKKSADNK